MLISLSVMPFPPVHSNPHPANLYSEFKCHLFCAVFLDSRFPKRLFMLCCASCLILHSVDYLLKVLQRWKHIKPSRARLRIDLRARLHCCDVFHSSVLGASLSSLSYAVIMKTDIYGVLGSTEHRDNPCAQVKWQNGNSISEVPGAAGPSKKSPCSDGQTRICLLGPNLIRTPNSAFLQRVIKSSSSFCGDLKTC